MLRARTLAALFFLLTLTVSGQNPAPLAPVFHPTPPLPSYDVATIKPADTAGVILPNGGRRITPGTTARAYIRTAYAPGAGLLTPVQVIGGPDWIDKDRYVIDGKAPADLEVAMQKMNTTDRIQHDHAMRQSLLAERFHLKVHFEVREMPVYALVPAKGGLKIKAVADPAPVPPADAQSPGTSSPRAAALSIRMGAGGAMELRATAISIAQFASLIGPLINQTPGFISLADTGNRPIVDQTGFTGNFDLVGFKWSAPQSTAADADANTSTSDLPALTTALEETLGLKLVSTKGPVEVIVIDSIDHPSEN